MAPAAHLAAHPRDATSRIRPDRPPTGEAVTSPDVQELSGRTRFAATPKPRAQVRFLPGAQHRNAGRPLTLGLDRHGPGCAYTTESWRVATDPDELVVGRVTRMRGPWDRRGVEFADIAECYEKHSADLIRYAATVVGPSAAEDVLSSAVVGLIHADVAAVIDPRGYLYRTVLNTGRKYLRSTARRDRRERLAAARDRVEPPDTDLDIRAALATLSAQQRAVIHLAYWEDLTPPMIADRLGVTDGTVRRQLARARRRLSEVLDDQI
jgi:RNA polymerase sigma factor (sigma-70 family)